ncbi:MAG: hypothetical protein ACRYFZ_06685 [Janthinobacterium lividum]
MPPTSPRTARHTFATSGPPRPGAFVPSGAPRRVTSRSLNDAVIRRSTPPVAQPRTAAGPTLLVFLTSSGQSLATAYVQFSQGVMDGLGDSLKSTWSLISHDMWQLSTYREMGTTLTALGLLDPLNVAQSLAAAHALDARLGTHIAQRMADIINAVKQLMRDAPHWTARQWGRAVGRVIGDLVLAKGAGGAVKLAAEGATTLNRVAAVRYLARTPSYADAFSEVKGFNLGVGQRSFKVQEELQWARKGRWMSNQKLASPAETSLKMALDYPGSLNRASRRWSVRRFGVYVEGTVAPQHNPLGGGGHQLFRITGKEAGYVEVPYK